MIHTYKPQGTHYHLRRESDGMGDSGPMLLALSPHGYSEMLHFVVAVGYSCRVGSFSARTISWQDYWTTTPVMEILQVTEDGSACRFRTHSGQIYTPHTR